MSPSGLSWNEFRSSCSLCFSPGAAGRVLAGGKHLRPPYNNCTLPSSDRIADSQPATIAAENDHEEIVDSVRSGCGSGGGSVRREPKNHAEQLGLAGSLSANKRCMAACTTGSSCSGSTMAASASASFLDGGMGLWKAWLGDLPLGWNSPVRGPGASELRTGRRTEWPRLARRLRRIALPLRAVEQWTAGIRLAGVMLHSLHGRIANCPPIAWWSKLTPRRITPRHRGRGRVPVPLPQAAAELDADHASASRAFGSLTR